MAVTFLQKIQQQTKKINKMAGKYLRNAEKWENAVILPHNL